MSQLLLSCYSLYNLSSIYVEQIFIVLDKFKVEILHYRQVRTLTVFSLLIGIATVY